MKRLFALLLVLAIVPAAYPFGGQNKIMYDKFHWQIYHSTHFDVYFYDEEKPSLQRVVDMAAPGEPTGRAVGGGREEVTQQGVVLLGAQFGRSVGDRLPC